MTAFVTVEQYATGTGTVVAPGSPEEGRIAFLLDAACAEIRNYTHQQLDHVAGDVILLSGRGTTELLLPEVPTVVVNSVMLDDELLTDYVVFHDTGILHREDGWPLGRANVIVDYDHGFDEVPSDLVNVAINVVRAELAVSPGSIVSETIGGYSYSRGQVTTGLEEYKRVLDPYRVVRVPGSRSEVMS